LTVLLSIEDLIALVEDLEGAGSRRGPIGLGSASAWRCPLRSRGLPRPGPQGCAAPDDPAY